MIKKFVLLVLLQVFVLFSMVISQYAVDWFGKEVRLKSAPVDPKDIFYGDYVTLNYEISDIDISEFDELPKAGDTVYVVVKKEGQYDQLVSAHLKKPSISSDEVLLKGRVTYVTNRVGAEQSQNPKGQSAHVVYGFERYYLQEGTGKEFEEKRGQFDVIIKTTSYGQHLTSLRFIKNE